ncbi:HAD-superfamily subfamily IB hydrolase, TIGR01490 [Demequina mangrovi]|uniref:HAD-superfamily subfamily IB hydrolase, TIGR01490 n=1 Tax=Demequina mangrovi TaxID=1043493 RepID=A0A1H6WG96_9MICO|nr:HAD-superfamily subfamily IB hydrolase, TIGR01490 [Demequina mangrovi]
MAAFFDVDNTVIRGASSFHIARGLWQRDYFRLRDIIKLGYEQATYVLFGESKDQMDRVREHGLGIINGWSVAEMTAVAEEVYDELLASRVYPGTKAIIDEHLERGHEVWFVTASPAEIGRLIARRVGATGALGTIGEHVDGHYTGRLVGEFLHGPHKADAVRELAAERGIALEDSYAYGDSVNDASMLETVGHPCAINPDPRMRRLATQRGWTMREFRKRRKSGRRGIVKSSVTGAAWITIQVTRGVKGACRGIVGLPRRASSAAGRTHSDEAREL